MAVQVVRGGSFLGGLGSLLGLGGALTGNPLLQGLGAGATAANGIMNGNGVDNNTLDTLAQVINGWKNPAQGNIASQAPSIEPLYMDWLKRTGGGR